MRTGYFCVDKFVMFKRFAELRSGMSQCREDASTVGAFLFFSFHHVSSFRSDLAFNFEGYASVLLNDVFTAANGVYTKQKIDPRVTAHKLHLSA